MADGPHRVRPHGRRRRALHQGHPVGNRYIRWNAIIDVCSRYVWTSPVRVLSEDGETRDVGSRSRASPRTCAASSSTSGRRGTDRRQRLRERSEAVLRSQRGRRHGDAHRPVHPTAERHGERCHRPSGRAAAIILHEHEALREKTRRAVVATRGLRGGAALGGVAGEEPLRPRLEADYVFQDLLKRATMHVNRRCGRACATCHLRVPQERQAADGPLPPGRVPPGREPRRGPAGDLVEVLVARAAADGHTETLTRRGVRGQTAASASPTSSRRRGARCRGGPRRHDPPPQRPRVPDPARVARGVEEGLDEGTKKGSRRCGAAPSATRPTRWSWRTSPSRRARPTSGRALKTKLRDTAQTSCSGRWRRRSEEERGRVPAPERPPHPAGGERGISGGHGGGGSEHGGGDAAEGRTGSRPPWTTPTVPKDDGQLQLQDARRQPEHGRQGLLHGPGPPRRHRAPAPLRLRQGLQEAGQGEYHQQEGLLLAVLGRNIHGGAHRGDHVEPRQVRQADRPDEVRAGARHGAQRDALRVLPRPPRAGGGRRRARAARRADPARARATPQGDGGGRAPAPRRGRPGRGPRRGGGGGGVRSGRGRGGALPQGPARRRDARDAGRARRPPRVRRQLLGLQAQHHRPGARIRRGPRARRGEGGRGGAAALLREAGGPRPDPAVGEVEGVPRGRGGQDHAPWTDDDVRSSTASSSRAAPSP